VDGGNLQLALREMQRHFSDPRVWGAIAVVSAILGFGGPFSTYQTLPLVPRLIYWTAIAISTYATGFLITVSAGRAVRERFRPWISVPLRGLMIGPPTTLVVIAVNLLTFGEAGLTVIDWRMLLVSVTLIGTGVTTISEIIVGLVRGAAAAAPPPALAAPEAPAILERMPVHLRGPLVALSVQDHYVEISTTKGKTLVLMRLGDAMRQVGDTKGLQIHRSHWVAVEAVTGVSRTNGKVAVTLKDGRTLPVSRGYMDQAKDAGLVV
jgi:hypothetical protein